MSTNAGQPVATRGREIEDFFDKKLELRRPHERQWFITRAFIRGQQSADWMESAGGLVTTTPSDIPLHRQRMIVNRMLSKVRARNAKFLKNRPIPICVPATMEIQDRLNARLSTKALEYEWRQARIESKYRDALDWASTCGHGLLWLHWDDTLLRRVVVGEGQQRTIQVAPIGDIYVEVVDPFQIVVDDPSIAYIGDQPRIGRLRLVPIEDIKANPRWAAKAAEITGESSAQEAFRFKDRIGALTSNGLGAGIASSAVDEAHPEKVLLFELYEKPCPRYPKGRLDIMAGGVLLEENDELPHGFFDLSNPYPVVDYPDFPQVGQYWITTIAEQMVGVQRSYNSIRGKVEEHLRLLCHPKILVAKQHQLAKGAWDSDSGEIVEYVAIPNVPPPTPWVPPPINADVWRTIELLIKEFDDISHIYPEAEGRVGNATSGFQTNLLQEATDAVHGPDIRAHEIITEELGVKLRRMMKLYFDMPRLLTVAGKNLQPEVFEFSAEQIDDFADIRVEAGSGLPTLKAARIQMIADLWKAGLLGNPQNPEDLRRVRAMLEMGTIEDQYDYDRQDDEAARLENAAIEQGGQLTKPDAFENHEIHYRVHTDILKSPASRGWPPERRQQLIAHLIMHVRYINPQSAVQLAVEYQMQPLVADIMGALAQASAVAGPSAPAAAPPDGTAAPSASSQAQAPPAPPPAG